MTKIKKMKIMRILTQAQLSSNVVRLCCEGGDYNPYLSLRHFPFEYDPCIPEKYFPLIVKCIFNMHLCIYKCDYNPYLSLRYFPF